MIVQSLFEILWENFSFSDQCKHGIQIVEQLEFESNFKFYGIAQ